MSESYKSQLLDRAVEEVSKLPGIGRKTALRSVLYLLKKEEKDVEALAESLVIARREIKYCKRCHNISDEDVCEICRNPKRDSKRICVVENIQDVLKIENTGKMTGLYHVLGGVISPMDGIGPQELEIDSLVERVKKEQSEEVILALSPTMEGDTTNYFLYKKLVPTGVKITKIARGVSIGNELEYTDDVTLGRSIEERIDYQG
ncbi:MAG: recombination mediator RecR [Paludibacteraceae bacterium]|nr:recombination mediator RecR [Paludibacteraceae bacterium]